MTTFAPRHIPRRLLSPLIAILALFFVAQGTAVPDVNSFLKAEISAPKKAKGSDSTLAKTSSKAAHGKLLKSSGTVALVCSAPTIRSTPLPAAFHSAVRAEFRSAALATAPSRAPPA